MKKVFVSILSVVFLSNAIVLSADNKVSIDKKSIIVKFNDSVVDNNQLKDTIEEKIDEDVKDVDLIDKVKSDTIEVETKKEIDVNSAVKEIEKMDNVEFAQPNYIYKSLANNENTTLTEKKVDNKTIRVAQGCESAKPYAWQIANPYLNAAATKNQLVSKGTVEVGVLDTGIRTSHNEFKGVYNSSKSYDFVDNDRNPLDSNYPLYHGSHVAGAIAGKSVGTGSNIKLVAYRVLDKNGRGSTSAIVRAVSKATKDKVKVLNLSLGMGDFDKVLYTALSKYNGVVVAAAGNDGRNRALYPAGYNLDNIISVGNMMENKRRHKSSNYHASAVDVSTYGTCVYSVGGGNANNDYLLMTGTSMSAPIVAASVAMNYAYNPAQSIQQLKASIIDGAVPTSTLNKTNLTNGYLNLSRSLNVSKNTHTNPYNNASHRAASFSNGVLRLYGSNKYGQIGNGNTSTISSRSPYTVRVNNGEKIAKYYLTATNTYVVTASGKLYVSGSNNVGQLGNPGYKTSNKFVRFRMVNSKHKVRNIDFRTRGGKYSESSINIYLSASRDALYYKLGTSSYAVASSKAITTKNIQLVKLNNFRKKAVHFYVGSNARIGKQEVYSYNNVSGITTGYSRKDYKNGKLVYKANFKYNKYGKLAYKNKSNAKYTLYKYRKNKAISAKSYNYNGSGKKVLKYYRKNNYSKKLKLTRKHEYFYNKNGKLRSISGSKSYYYITTYKKGKANKTYRYTINNKGKKASKSKVKVRKG